MALLYRRRREIEALAEAVLSSQKNRVPPRIETIVEQLGGQVSLLPATSQVDALVRKAGSTFEIHTKPQATTQKRFSIAHELGHLFLHMGYIINETKWRQINVYIDEPYYRFGYNTEELEANEFAACLLMPREQFSMTYYETVAQRKPIKALARKFEVSEEAARLRAKFLGLDEDVSIAN
jgi:hypothetical protein